MTSPSSLLAVGLRRVLIALMAVALMLGTSSHFQPQGAKLVGTVSGDEYVGTGITRDNFSEPVGDNGATTFTFVNNRIIGKGDAPNFLEHGVTHITLNANGELTADVHFESAECK